MTLDHIGLPVSDYRRSRDFYDRCLAPLGIKMIAEDGDWCGYGRGDIAEFWFGPDTASALPMHIAFSAPDRAAVDRFHAAAIAAGGRDNGAPGLRTIYHPHYYGAFVLDPDGHNIEAVCHTDPAHSEVEITSGYLPGLVGRVAELHALYYTQNWGFTAFFETRVASEMSAFINRYDANRDCTWSALLGGKIEASITVDGIDADSEGAHLRWFISSERLRGKGIGSRLMDTAMAFCHARAYRRIYLETFDGLEAARHLYESAGFRLVETRRGEQWGSRVDEQRYLAEF